MKKAPPRPTIKKMRFKGYVWFLMAVYLFGSIFLLASCKKDRIPDNMVTIQVKTEGLIINKMEKSFDFNSFVVEYNPLVYKLTFTGQYNTYTFDKTIQELITGFEITVLPDNYNITYTSIHTAGQNTVLSKYCDVVINDTKQINSSGVITLEGKHDDFLIVFDKISEIAYLGEYSNRYCFFDGQNGNSYKYGYYNIEGNTLISYNINGNVFTNTIPNATKNNIYHIVSNNTGIANINILPFNITKFGW